MASLQEAHERALALAQQQERRALEAEAELREARHALRELATQLPVCERLVADLRADSAASDSAAEGGAGAVSRVPELEKQLAQASGAVGRAESERDAMRIERDTALASLQRAREETASLSLKLAEAQKSQAPLEQQLEEARRETERAKAQASRALTLAGRSAGSERGGEGSRVLLASLEASEQQLAQAKAERGALEARLAQQAGLMEKQEALLLTYAMGQDTREAQVRQQEEALATRRRHQRERLAEWRALVARREAALQERQAALASRAEEDEEGARKAAGLRRSQRLYECQRELMGCREELSQQREQAETWQLQAEARAAEARRLQERLAVLEAAAGGGPGGDGGGGEAATATGASAAGSEAESRANETKGRVLERWMGATGVHARRAKAASTEALLQQLEEQQMLLSILQAADKGEGEADPAAQRRRDNVRRREAERVARLAKAAARAEELEQLLLQKADDAADLHTQLAELLSRPPPPATAPPEEAAFAVAVATASAAAAAAADAGATAAGVMPRTPPRTPNSYRHMTTAQLRALLVARGVPLPPSPTRLEVERLCDEAGLEQLPAVALDARPLTASLPPPPASNGRLTAALETPAGLWSEQTVAHVTRLARAEQQPGGELHLSCDPEAAGAGGGGGGGAWPPATPEEEKFALQRERLLRMSEEARAEEAGSLAARWRESRSTLVTIACALRNDGLLHAAFRAWLELLWQRRLRLQAEAQQGAGPLLILTSLEEQRRRLMRMLHASHLENRWHRQYLSRTVHHKLLLLLWCGGGRRTLQRCWMAWGVHMMRVRMAREQRHELHQLAYALRVATFAQKPLLAVPADRGGGDDVMEREAALFSGYSLRRAWLGWTDVVAQARLERDYRARARRAARAPHEPPKPPKPPKPSVSSAGLLGWFVKPALAAAPAPAEIDGAAAIAATEAASAVARVEAELRRLRDEREMSVAWLTWRVQAAQAKLRALEDADKCALVTSLWKTATCGVMDTQMSVGRVMKGRGFFGLDEDDDEDDEDDEDENQGAAA